jgi:hypothetical protein
VFSPSAERSLAALPRACTHPDRDDIAAHWVDTVTEVFAVDHIVAAAVVAAAPTVACDIESVLAGLRRYEQLLSRPLPASTWDALAARLTGRGTSTGHDETSDDETGHDAGTSASQAYLHEDDDRWKIKGTGRAAAGSVVSVAPSALVPAAAVDDDHDRYLDAEPYRSAAEWYQVGTARSAADLALGVSTGAVNLARSAPEDTTVQAGWPAGGDITDPVEVVLRPTATAEPAPTVLPTTALLSEPVAPDQTVATRWANGADPQPVTRLRPIGSDAPPWVSTRLIPALLGLLVLVGFGLMARPLIGVDGIFDARPHPLPAKPASSPQPVDVPRDENLPESLEQGQPPQGPVGR